MARNWKPYLDALASGPLRCSEVRDRVFGKTADKQMAYYNLQAAHQVLLRMSREGAVVRPGYGYYALPRDARRPVPVYQSFVMHFPRHRGGMTFADIQEKFGCSYHTARHWAERYKREHGLVRTMEQSDTRGKPRRYWSRRKVGRKPKPLRQPQQAA